MAWPASDVEALVAKRPRLAIALLQVVAQRNIDFIRRIQSFSLDSIEGRLARLLLHFAGRLGTPEGDGSVRMMPFTHETLSRYVGTSREIVTQHMSRFRREGRVSYSRRNGIVVYRHSFQGLLGTEESSGLAARGAN
jgi:CRP/FNR family transcriptional regulator